MEFLEILASYWHIIIAIATTIFFLSKEVSINREHERRIIIIEKNQENITNLLSQGAEHEKRISKNETKLEQMNPVLLDIRERLISIETTLKLHIHDDTNQTKSK